ncbi:hypothetical protein BT69DRAFT_380130 [Atractiella rhizophila]|nr:hypothetical protein BT69DRAFT_380130 [Atractiella rhizophila]
MMGRHELRLLNCTTVASDRDLQVPENIFPASVSLHRSYDKAYWTFMPDLEDLRAVLRFEQEWMSYRLRKLHLEQGDPGRPKYYFKRMQMYQLLWNPRDNSAALPTVPEIFIKPDHFPPRVEADDPVAARTRMNLTISIPFCVYGNHPRLSSIPAVGPGASLVLAYHEICPRLIHLWEWAPYKGKDGTLILPPVMESLPTWDSDEEPKRPFTDEDTAYLKYRGTSGGVWSPEALGQGMDKKRLREDEGKDPFWIPQSVLAWRDLTDIRVQEP